MIIIVAMIVSLFNTSWAVSIHWTGLLGTGLLDWTTGLTQNGVKCPFQPFSV